MKGILITGGEQPVFDMVSHYFIKKADNAIYICAADSGLDYCLSNSIRPDYILGDMDSLSDKNRLRDFPDEIIEEHPSEKDFTDSELGLLHLKKQGCTEIIMIGGGGGRLDHLLALLSIFERPNPPDKWITAHEEIHHISDEFRGRGNSGDMVSFFPVGSTACTMSSSGLKWPLNTLCWKKGDVGISNRLESEDYSVKMKTGRLILIRGLKNPHQSL